MADDPIFDPWALDEESRPKRVQRGSRWRSATESVRGLPLVTPITGTVRRPSPPQVERAFPVRPSKAAPADVAWVSVEELGPDDMALAPAIFNARPLSSAEPLSIDDLRPDDVADFGPSRAPHADPPDPGEYVSIDSLSPDSLSPDAAEPADVTTAPDSGEPFGIGASTPTGPGAWWTLRADPGGDAGRADAGPIATAAHPPSGIEAAIAALEALLRPRVERVSQRLRISRHDTHLDDRLDQRPPSLRLDLRRWVAPFERPDKGGGAILEIVLEGVGGDAVTGRYWLDRRSLSPSAQRSVALNGLTPAWIDELLLEFVEKALVH